MEEHEESEDDQFFFSHAPRMPEDDIIMSEVAILTGGRDQHGRPIITFPAKYHGILESKVKASGMDILLRYYIDITRPKDRQRGFAFVTDLRFSVLDFIIFMKSALNSLQAEMNGAIGTCVFYVILPLNKKTHKNTMTHLSLRESKKKINKNIVAPFFQSVGVDDEVELYNYIDKSHLTTELGGYLQYSHQDWVVFRRVVEPFFSAFETFQAKLSHAFHRLTTMMNINGGNTKGELQRTLNIVQDEYNDIRRELNLDPVLDVCEELLRRFTCCEEEDVFTVLAQKPVFKETKDAVESCYRVLSSAKKKIEDDWNELSGGIIQAMQHIDYTTNVNKLLEWFKFKKERDLKQHGVIAYNLSDAEVMYNHFETGLLPKAKEKLEKANDLVLLGERMIVDFNTHRVSDIVTLNQTLKDDTDEFQTLVKKRHQVLLSVYHFHQLYNKARRWYIKCLRFLPSDLSDLYNELRSHSQDDHLGASQLQWEEDVRRFLHKSPLLAKEELKKVKMIPEQIGDLGLKKKGRLLPYRCSILTSFLSHKNKTTIANIVDILKWRSELLNQADDSTSCQSETRPTSDQIRKAQSESSLDSAGLSQRPRKSSSKRQSKTASKNHKKKLDKDEPLHRSIQTLSRSKRDKRRDDRHSDADGNSMGDSDTDDPLVRRLGQGGEIYHRHGDRQGQLGHDEIDHSETKAQKTQRNKQISSTRKRELPSITRQLQPTRLVRSQSVPHHDPSRTQLEQAQTYGIYGDVELDDDTAVVIHHQVPLHSSQSLPVSPGVAHQQGPSYPTQTPPVDSSSGIVYHQVLPHPSQGPRVGISSSVNQQLSHPPQAVHVERLSGNNSPHQHMPNWNPGGQHVPLSMDPSNITLGNQPSYGVQDVVTPSNLQYNATQLSHDITSNHQHSTNIQHGSPNENHIITASPNFNANNSYAQSPSGMSPLKGQFVNAAKQAPISFHGSLMNIHQPQSISPVIGRNAETQHVIGSSPVARHQSLINLSQSPQFDGDNSQYIRMQESAWQPDPSQYSAQAPHNNRPYISSLSPVHTGLPNPGRNTLSNLRHGFSEPNLSSLGYEQPPTYDIPGHHGNLSHSKNATLKSRLPDQYGSSNHGTLSSRHPLSRSEVDLRHIPENLNQFGSLHHGLSHSNQSLHRSDPELRHISPARNTSVYSPNQNAGYSPTPYLSSPGEDPQLEYYKKLYSSSPQLNQSTSASGRRSTSHTLDPAVHTWMHDVPSTITISHPAGRRLLSPLKLLELEVANKTMDAEDAIIEDDYEKQQLKRHAVIDSIIGRSDLGIIRSQDNRLSTQVTPRLRHHVYDEGQRSVSIPSNRLDSVRSPSRTAERSLKMSPLSAARTERHPELHYDTPSSQQVPRLYQSRQVHLPHTGRSYITQGGSLINEIDWRDQHLRDLGLASQETTPAIVGGSSLHSSSQLINRTERDFGLSSTLPQFSMHQQSPRSVNTSYNESNQRLNDLYELGIIPPNDYMDLDVGYSSQYPGNASLHLENINTLAMDRNSGQERDNNWRLQHLRELGLSPHQANSRVMENVYPESMHHSSSLSGPNWRYENRPELGISQGAGRKRDSTMTLSNGGNHTSHYLDEGQNSPTNHHPVNQSAVSGTAVPSSRSLASDTNWRQDHLQELGLSPGYNDSYRSNNVHVPLRKPAIRISDADEQRHPQPAHAVPSHSIYHSQMNNIQAHGTPQTRNLGIQSNVQQNNPQDAGISPRQRANLREPADIYHNGVAQRTQAQTHISPSEHQNATSNPRGQLSDPNWRSNNLRELGISPTMQQYANRTQYDLADVAPVTSRLRGVIASGRSPSNMEDVHHFDEDTRKKSVRFAKVSDETILDEEEKAQEEVALRLQQLELKLQEEESMLMHEEVTREEARGRPRMEARDIPPHQQPSTLRQHQTNSDQPNIPKQVSYEHPGYNRGLTKRTVQQPFSQNSRRNDVEKSSNARMQSGNQTSPVHKPSIASKSDMQNGHPGPIKTQDGHPGPIRTQDGHPGPIRTQDGHPGPIRTQDGHPGPIRTQDGHPGPIRTQDGHPGPRTQDGHSGPIRTQDGHPGPIRTQDGNPGPIRTQDGHPGPIRTQDGFLGTTKTVTPDKMNLKSYSRPSYGKSSAGATSTESQEVMNIGQTNLADNRVVPSSGLQNQHTGNNVDDLNHRQSQGTSQENYHHSLPVNGAQITNGGPVDPRSALPITVKPSTENYVGNIHDRADRGTIYESISPNARLQNYNLNTSRGSVDPSTSLQTVDKPRGTRSEVLINKSGVYQQTANRPLSAAASGDTPFIQEKPTLPSQERTRESAAKVRPFNRQVSIGGRDHNKHETTEERQKPPDVMELENQVLLNGSQSMYKPSDLGGVPRDNEDETSSGLYQTDEFIMSRPQLERDHTAADYIACALGLDYVSDKTDLTVQPHMNSNQLDNNQDYEYSNESLPGDTPPRQAQRNVGQLLDSSQNGNGGHAQSNPSDAQGANVSTNSFEGPPVTLPGCQDGLVEGPCSPIRQWLKEKEIMEAENGVSQNKPLGESKANHIASPTENQTAEVGKVSGSQEARSPAIKSQSTSPIRQWLREKQNKKNQESTDNDQGLDHMGSSSFVDDASTSKISDFKTNKFGYLGTRRGTDSETNLLNQRERSHSSSPSLLSTGTPSENKSGEQRRRSSSSIPVYKGLSKSSQQKTKKPSQRRMSDTLDMSPDAFELMKKRAVDSRKGNKYSKIPVPKVFKALKEGGFLATDTSKSNKGSLPQQVSALKKSNQAADHLEHAQKEESRPGFERQGTFTKEERPPFNKEGTFTIESEDGNDKSQKQEANPDAKMSSHAQETSAKEASFSPLGLVLDHIVKKGNVSKSRKANTQTTDGKKRHDSQEEIFENSSTESSMSPTSKSTTIISKKPTSNIYNNKHYHINVHGLGTGIQNRTIQPEIKDAEGDIGSYAGLAESDRLEHENLDENDLEKMIAMKSQLAEIRNLEIENRHLAYERKEFEAHYLKNMQEHQPDVETHSDEEG